MIFSSVGFSDLSLQNILVLFGGVFFGFLLFVFFVGGVCDIFYYVFDGFVFLVLLMLHQ